MSYLGERWVLCVGNGSHFCTPVLMNMCNITFQVLRLSTFAFNKCSEKKIFTIILFVVKSLEGFGWNNIGPALQTVAQHYISIGPMYRVIWCFWRRDVKASPAYCSRQKAQYNHPMLFQWQPASKTMGQHWNRIDWMPSVCARYTTEPMID